MNIPSIPTDNLYKFLALSGLLIFAISLLYPQHKKIELSLKRNDISVDEKKLQHKINALVKHLEKLNKNKIRLQDVEIEKLDGQVELLSDRQDEIEGKKAAQKILEEELSYYSYFKFYGICIGLFVSIVGFGCWYVFVQRPNDIKSKLTP